MSRHARPPIRRPPSTKALAAITLRRQGLVPAIAQQHDTGEVLMMAWMDREAVAETMRTGRVCYWSRSRKALWRKGETSGHIQDLVDLRIDCDGDTLLVLVDQTGVACHTGTAQLLLPRDPRRRARGDRAGEIDMDERREGSSFAPASALPRRALLGAALVLPLAACGRRRRRRHRAVARRPHGALAVQHRHATT